MRWRLKSPAPRLPIQPFIQGTDQRKHQSSASLAFVRGIHRWPVNSPHKGPVTRKMFPFYDVIMGSLKSYLHSTFYHCHALCSIAIYIYIYTMLWRGSTAYRHYIQMVILHTLIFRNHLLKRKLKHHFSILCSWCLFIMLMVILSCCTSVLLDSCWV